MARPSKYTDDVPAQMLAHFTVPKTQKILTKHVKSFFKDGQVKSESEEYKTVPNDFPTFEEFARKLSVNGDTLVEWSHALIAPDAIEGEPNYGVLKHPEYSATYNACKALQKAFLVDNGLQGNSPPATTIFVLKNVTDMTDKTIVETDDKNYKEKSNALNKFFDTLRHHVVDGPGSPIPDP